MSKPGLHKLQRIAYYLMVTNVSQVEMQGRYEACSIINRIMKEIQFGEAIKKRHGVVSKKGKLPK